MDLFDELENMAVSAVFEDSEAASGGPAQGTVQMWQERFGYSHNQAAELLQITKAATKSVVAAPKRVLSPAQARTMYVLKLDGPISTPQKVQIAASLPTNPHSYHGTGEDGDAMFCKVDGRAKMAIEIWLSAQQHMSFRPLFVSDGRAYKELSPDSFYPTLGKDTTLPQFRPQDPHLLHQLSSFGRAYDQFPVWYFFNGTLANVPKLRSLLSLSEAENPVMCEASVTGGTIETWGNGKYNALIDRPKTSCVKGSAYRVMSEEHEDALRRYETNAYEVVRCSIEMDGGLVEGCTFRFVGEID